MEWVVNVTPWPLYPREWPGTHCMGGRAGPRASLDGCGKSRPRRDSIPVPYDKPNSTQQNPYEAHGSSAIQETNRILSNARATCPHPQPEKCNHALPSSFFKINSNNILPSKPRFSRWSLSKSSHQNPVRTSVSHTCYCPAHPLDFIPWIIFGEYRP